MDIIHAWDSGETKNQQHSDGIIGIIWWILTKAQWREKELTTILSRDDKQLETRLKNYLGKGYVGPITKLSLRIDYNEPARALISYIKNQETKCEEQVKATIAKMQTFTAKLIKDFDIDRDIPSSNEENNQNNYFINLIELAEELEIKSIWKDIIDKMESGKYKGIMYDSLYPKGTVGNPDLHYRMYILFDILQDSDKVNHILKEDIYSPSYTATAFRHLCNLDIENYIKYLPDFMTAYRKRDKKYFMSNPSIIISSIMEENIKIKELIVSKMKDPTFTVQFTPEDIEMINQVINNKKK